LPRVIERVRSNPKLAVAIACGVLLLLAWIGWAIFVTSDHGSRAGLGVLVAWPALIAGLGLVVLAFYGLYLLIRRLLPEEGTATVDPPAQEEPSEEEGEDEDEDEDEPGSDDESEDEDEEEAEASTKS
jgi:TRAP-type C4-dicarboxylate transport system permease small subunit